MYRLPKKETEKDLFEVFMEDEVEVMASLCPVFLEWEKRWILDIGSHYRIKLPYSLLREVDDGEAHTISIDRNDYLGCSKKEVLSARASDLRKGVAVKYVDELGEGSGVTRDWFITFSEKIIGCDGRPFNSSGEDTASDHTRIFPRRGSGLDPTYYRCCGRLFGLAVLHRVQIGYTFDNVLFLQLRGNDVKLEDIKYASPSMYKHFKDLLSMDAKTILAQGIYFPDDLEDPTNQQVTNVDDVQKFISNYINTEFVKGTETANLIEGLDEVLGEGKQHFFEIIALPDFDLILRGVQDLNLED